MLRRSPRLIYQVVGQSRDDALTAVQAGGHHPGSHLGFFVSNSGRAIKM